GGPSASPDGGAREQKEAAGLGCSPLPPQTGQAPMPWPASTRWATAICCDREAPAAVEAYLPPPYASQVPWENWSPPEKPLPVLVPQLPPDSQAAVASQFTPAPEHARYELA